MAPRRIRHQYAKQACINCRKSKTRCCQALDSEKLSLPTINRGLKCEDFVDQKDLSISSLISDNEIHEIRENIAKYPGKCVRCKKRGVECTYSNKFNKRGPKTRSPKMLVANLVQ
ncbi:14365_t:CDS:1 [Acaulospora morrowiae]|uniref:14365_t:CDS:1 n=1 Tax=Acaulospora morrowiae TaxID=94023 RepID=A0A9N8W2K0_9GLOM|nr:14365_t:CDS:1 [Acaulospora morrowiae]